MKMATALAWLLLPTPAIAIAEFQKWRGRRSDRAALAGVKKQERFVDTLSRICGVR